MTEEDEIKENEETLWNDLSERLKDETSQILDTELTKYESWLKTMMLFMEENVQKNENDIQSLIQTQKYLILKILQTKTPSIETLKVGYFVENELKSKSSPNVIKNKKTHIPTPSTPLLGQSFTPIIGLNQLEQSDSSDDDGLITSPHGRSSSLRINIQQNIYNSNYTETKSKKRTRKKKKRPKSLRLINQVSDPINSSNYQSEGDMDTDDVLCTIDSLNDENSPKKKPKMRPMRRRRSNSFSADSPSKLKLHGFKFTKSDSYLE